MTREEAVLAVARHSGAHALVAGSLVDALFDLGLLTLDVNEAPVEDAAVGTFPPREWRSHEFHWLHSERSTPYVCQWLRGAWWPANELGRVPPAAMFSRGWRWYAPAIPPAEWQGKRVDAP